MAEEITKVIENVDEFFPEIIVNGESHVSERYVEPESTPSQSLPQSSEEQTEEPSQQNTQGEYVDILELNGVEHDLKDSPLSAEVQALQTLLSTIQSRLNELNALIPSTATAQNQLADKNFVNSSIATNTANFLGTYTSLADIEAIQNPTNNDYAFLETADGAGNNVYDRYKYSAEDGEWLFEYELNNSSFTAEQWATINSGITQVSDTVQDGDTNPVSSDAVYEALQNVGGGGGAQCDTAGNAQAKVATMDGFVLNTGVTFPITFANSNAYNGKITLNVNNTGAKDVYINNAVSSSSNKTLNAGSYICWYDGTNYYIDTGYAVTNARNAGYATSAGSATTATSAGKLTTARKVYVKLGTASTSETKDFSGDTAIPVNGTLKVANGGTGMTTASYKNAVVVGNASTVTNALRTIRTANGAFYATAQDGAPLFGTLPVGQGGTGATSLANITVGNSSKLGNIAVQTTSIGGATTETGNHWSYVVKAKFTSTSGYIVYSNGLKIQWGIKTSVANGSVTNIDFFSVFSSSTYVVSLMEFKDYVYGHGKFFHVKTKGTSSCAFVMADYDANFSCDVLWFSIGY